MRPIESVAPSRSDHELASAARAGDYAAFEEIVRRYRDRVYRLAYGMTRNAHEAEEVLQDTFLNIFKNLEQFRGDSALSSWIYRVAANAALMRLRGQKRKPLLSLEEAVPNFDTTVSESLLPAGEWARQADEKLLSKELATRIEDAISRLPEKYRLVLLLRDVEGLANDEVAQTLGITVPTVKSRLHRSRLYVRAELEHYFNHS
ncbi:MAG: sigma-70 family RNA polymerase sigma factor [Deltaproteobacteria bacterium]|nr:sigma-70 family RNA polymerase sigma factor [Deltaproteobacteria bacterium]